MINLKIRAVCIEFIFQFLPHIFGSNSSGATHKIQELLAWAINARETRDTRMAFEALRFLAALFCHKKFLMEWVTAENLGLILDVPRPSVAAAAVSQCLYYLSNDEDCMEKVCLMPEPLLQKMVK